MVGTYRKFDGQFYGLESLGYQNKSVARNKANKLRSTGMNARVIPTSKGYAVYVKSRLIRRTPTGNAEGNLYLKKMKKQKLGVWGQRFADMKINGFTNKQLKIVDNLLDSSSCYGSYRVSESAKRQLDLVKSTPKNKLFEDRKSAYLARREADIKSSYPEFYDQFDTISRKNLLERYYEDDKENNMHYAQIREMAIEFNKRKNDSKAKKLGYRDFSDLETAIREAWNASGKISWVEATDIGFSNTKKDLRLQIEALNKTKIKEQQIRFDAFNMVKGD
jgi:hypothetical protein